ncbi:hypothetical protein [Mesorhizobium sp. CN2-181]|uniref:hypothetical protein n=1 Tax=Mesorhizobium yinganensis TaxID=3157707 RepID=UPI0032B8046A
MKKVKSIIKRLRSVVRRLLSLISLRTQKSGEKTLESYFEDLTHFASKANVNELKLGDEYLWPHFRQRLWVQLYGLGRGKRSKAIMPPEIMQRGRLEDVPLATRSQLKEQYKALDIDEMRPEEYKVDFLFMVVTNASEQVLLPDGRYYHRVSDPFYEIAAEVGSVLKMEMLRVKSPHLDRSFSYYHKVQYVMAPVPSPRQDHLRMSYPVGLLKRLNRRIPSLHYTHPIFRRFINWEMHTRDYYIQLLQRVNPRFVLLNGFHYHSPLISAAHHLGIQTVDIQHGIQVGYNPLYNNWEEMPPEGYQAVVDKFFVWGQKEADSIKKVFKGAKHSAVVTGFPWLARQLELTPSLDEQYKEKFSQHRVRILLVLQNQKDIPLIFKDLIRQSPADYLWIVRHHPKGKRFTLNDFAVTQHDNVLIGPYFDRIVLAQLFEYTDIAVSEGSTVAIEADYSGLYNFVFGDKGYKNYTREVDNGSFFHIKTAAGFFSKAAKLDLSVRRSRTGAYAKTDIKAMFQRLLGEGAEQNAKG